MNKIVKPLLIIVVVSFLQYWFCRDWLVSYDFIGNIVTFLSIIFGFYITSLAIFATSRYVAGLYKVSDKNDKSATLLHTLIDNYKAGLIYILISIVYVLLVQLSNQTEHCSVSLKSYLLFPFLGVIAGNIVYGYDMLCHLINVILQEAKSNSEKEQK
jgi:hypothetical protein